MRGAILHAPGDVRFEELDDPKIINPTEAVIRTVATCVCGSDLWDYRGINPAGEPTPFGHEYVGVVEEVGSDVKNVQVGQFVIGSFFASDNTCPNCRNGYQTNCLHREFVGAEGCQAEKIRIPLADGTLVATPEQPAEEHIASLLACSDVMGTGWYAAVAAEVRPGDTVAVVGDGAVGLCAIIAAKELGCGSAAPARASSSGSHSLWMVASPPTEQAAARPPRTTSSIRLRRQTMHGFDACVPPPRAPGMDVSVSCGVCTLGHVPLRAALTAGSGIGL
ncbi:alcohol dehydrogenase catalytic domain-containing protein [Streptomyces sp. NPDC127172]|jgi:D-arabinose 1-dehydrogenase-like Zn-dependent alcohol dehydrogenase|uniref:alcohol dehydrogenase catalytic domain-containing protein n=1 Tax=Streptomyces sp. NPDC127172 TaxID=3345382 RepID=UPI0036356FE8